MQATIIGTLLASGVLLSAAAPVTRSQAPNKTYHLTVHIQHNFAGATLRMDDGLMTAGGTKLSVSRLAYLISDAALLRADGSRMPLSGGPAYLNPAENRTAFSLSGAPPGDYKGIIFKVGLEPAANHADPSLYPPQSPLNPLVNHLHWGWQGGYVFLAIEGHYTRPDGGSGGYSFHIATDKNRMQVVLPGAIHVAGNTQCSLNFDVSRVFRGAAPTPKNGGDSTHSAPLDTLAERIKMNVEHAFSLAGCGPSGEANRNTQVVVPSAPARTHPYPFYVPPGFPQPDLPHDNSLTLEGVALGERLFAEKRLSGGSKQSCASCHRPDQAFSDHGLAHSRGIDGLESPRRTMPLFNLAWSGPYTWDGRRTRLRDQALAPVENTREMHADLGRVVALLSADPIYPPLFRAAFGTDGISKERIGLALEQYMLTLISADSRFDRALRGQEQLTEQEKRGLMLFLTEYDPARGRIGADCFHCHGGNLFSDYRYTNNGLDDTFKDRGRASVTGRDADLGKFKTPSLRNVAITGPYMHDGRFKTLEEVIEHYTTGIHRTATLDPNIAKHPDSGMVLSTDDKKALVAFLKTLTDYRYETAGR